ncbi:MAG: type II secretion system F family protein [Calditrichia bacterium]
MPLFVYKAVGPDGRSIENQIVAPSEQDVIQHLKKLNLIPVEIREQAARVLGRRAYRKFKIKDVILFTKQLHTLMRSGVPIMASLNAIKEQSDNPAVRSLVEQIAREVEQGNSLSAALSQFPQIFPRLYTNSIKVGELSGTLEDTLQYLTRYLEEENEIRKNIKKAFRYPMLVVLGLVLAFLVFTSFVIPNFVPVFQASGVELPLPTRILIAINELLTQYGLLLLLVVVAAVIGIILYIRTPGGRFQFHYLMLRLPIFGALLTKVNMTRFAKIYHTMNRTGIPVIKAFETMQETIDNEVYRREIALVLERIKEGEGIANSLRKSSYFSSFTAEMIAIGEKSGSLDEMLESISNYYDLEVRETVNNMSSMIEPVVTVVLGGMVLLLALAIFLPMWDMMTLVH